jgi:hypothetical protein
MRPYLDLAYEKAKKEGRLRSFRRGRARAAFALVVLLGGLGLPLLGLVLADGPAPLCCGKGRCCCTGDTASQDDRPCLRRSCGCEHRDATPAGTPLQIEALLPASEPLVTVPPREARWEAVAEQPLPWAEAPPVPPPRRSLPA